MMVLARILILPRPWITRTRQTLGTWLTMPLQSITQQLTTPIISTTHWLLMAVGFISPEPGVAGSRQFAWETMAGNLTLIAAAGSTQIADGIGGPTIPGAGRRFIMAAGSMTNTAAGAGGRTMFGDRPG